MAIPPWREGDEEAPETPREAASSEPSDQSLEPLRGSSVASRINSQQHLYEVRPRKDRRGFDLISDALPFGRLWYGGPNAIANAIGYAKFFSRSHDAVIRVYGAAGNVIQTHEHAGDSKMGRRSKALASNVSVEHPKANVATNNWQWRTDPRIWL
jgi:hypothetical protein